MKSRASCWRSSSRRLLDAADSVHEVVEAFLADPEPEKLLVAKLDHRLVDLLEGGTFLRSLLVDLHGRLVGGHQVFPGELAQLRAACDEPPQGRGVLRIVLGEHPRMRFPAGRLQDVLI